MQSKRKYDQCKYDRIHTEPCVDPNCILSKRFNTFHFHTIPNVPKNKGCDGSMWHIGPCNNDQCPVNLAFGVFTFPPKIQNNPIFVLQKLCEEHLKRKSLDKNKAKLINEMEYVEIIDDDKPSPPPRRYIPPPSQPVRSNVKYRLLNTNPRTVEEITEEYYGKITQTPSKLYSYGFELPEIDIFN